jgi:hypothetical protein
VLVGWRRGKVMISKPDPPNDGSTAAAPKRKVQRHSPRRLLEKKLVLPGGVIVSAERHKGRIVVRVESPSKEG